MNEVRRIHLGRQPFTISVDAHQTLKAYLAEIQDRVADQEVANEVEIRMSELLLERGIAGEKVILHEDVDFLKQQLGDPTDFSDDDEAPAQPSSDEQAPKRLFRDTDNALLAGVSAGIASYFGIDVVIIRLVFALLTIFSAGFGVVLYILLWLAIPPATTASEKLQMQGKFVTLEALKDSVSKADIRGTAARANSTILPFINRLFSLGIKFMGLCFIVSGLSILFGLAATKTYMLLHHGQLFQENLFPVGSREQTLVVVVMILVAIVALFLLLIGVASFKRKWPLRGWVTGALLGVFMLGLAGSLALSADIAPRVHQRYETSLHTTAVPSIQPFTNVTTAGGIDLTYVSSPTYSVSVRYLGNPDLSKLKINVKDGTLYIDSTALDGIDHCTMLCLFPKYNMTVQIAAPNIEQFKTPPRTDIFYPNMPTLN